MKRLFLISIIFLIIIFLLICPDIALYGKEKLKIIQPHQKIITPEINYLEKEPQIDGRLDPDLSSLPERSFNYLYMSNSDNPEIGVRYRVAYGISFFYLFIEADSASYICRDRGYQNGDGFVILFSIPKEEGTASDERYLLAFNPTCDPDKPYTKMVWFYNNTWPFVAFDDQTKFSVLAENGKVGFELLLPWKEIYPYHPLLMDKIGFNLFFVKGFGEVDGTWYMLVGGVNLQALQSACMLLQFQKPELKSGDQTYVVFDKNNIKPNEEIDVKTVTVSSGSTNEKLYIIAYTAEDTSVDWSAYDLYTDKGVFIKNYKFSTDKLPPGGYQIKWRTSNGRSKGEFPLTVFPKFEDSIFSSKLKSLETKISEGSLNTIRFMYQEILKNIRKLKSYDSAGDIRINIYKLNELLEEAAEGKDLIAGQKRYVRRAFVSRIDNTLQPYMVKIPENYSPSKKYPAVVFLHGSDSDDTSVTYSSWIADDDFIVIAPYGRGQSNAFSIGHAQEDIQEAIEDAARNYSIDIDNMVIAGFSMGGYGAYRTFYETPEKYKGVAVFSGHPNIANNYFNTNVHPDFLQSKFLERFKGAKVAIFHGRKDRNCPFGLTDDLVKKMKEAGADVRYFIDETVGHSQPKDPKILEAYYNWLREILINDKE